MSKEIQQAPSLSGVDSETCTIVFKNHWAQVIKILERHDPLKNSNARHGVIPPDEASAVQNYVEHMIFLLIEEQAEDAAMGPILEFVVTENVMEKLFLWSLRREFTDEMKVEQIKMYEMLVTQCRQPLLHHKPILKPLMMMLSACSGTTTSFVETELVLLLNQLCSTLAKDPSILELFFHTSEDQGAANFLIFSLLIPFIHREGGVGQQARDALLFIMSISSEREVAKHIVDNTYFCPVLATGLSGLYSSLPTKLEVRSEEWHYLQREDWMHIPPLVQFMNSLEFCNAVIQVAHPLIKNQLVNYIYNGFLVPVMAPALHKTTVEEVMTTTAYLDLFLRSISEPAMLQTFLSFILLHEHENLPILDTLVSRINTPFRLCVVSLALFRTLISLNCEDVMLQLVLRYLIPCNHMMLSQRQAVRERDCYSVSAAKLLALTPACCSSGTTLVQEQPEGENVLGSRVSDPSHSVTAGSEGEVACVEIPGDWDRLRKPLDVSYLHYLWEARVNITACVRKCKVWSAPYDGENPDPEHFSPALTEGASKRGSKAPAKSQHNPAVRRTRPIREKMQPELEWDDSYDTGMSPSSDDGSLHPYSLIKQGTAIDAPPADPPKHIQEMKKSALMLIRGSYIEESDFHDDVMVYRLCAEKDAQDNVESNVKKVKTPSGGRITDQKAQLSNGPVNRTMRSTSRSTVSEKQNAVSARGEQGTEMEHSGLAPDHDDQTQEAILSTESKGFNQHVLSMETEDFLSQYHDLLAKLNYNPNELSASNQNSSEPSTPTEDEDDFEKFTVAPHTDNLTFPFGPKVHLMFSNNPARIHGAPFTGPFISVLLSKMENMIENELHVNLLLTGIVAQLACYPQPLLRSFLLNTNMVFQPSVRSLYQVLASVKNSIEQFAAKVENFTTILTQSRENLLARVDNPSSYKGELTDKENGSETASRAQNGHQQSDIFSKTAMPSSLKNSINAAVIFIEFLKELAAIAQEHSILSHSSLVDCEE
ncbi:FHF complex subunit HOOK-interacting protein 1A [Hypanus sabinus]|uniref:FHF complex subunit HOOK-interacting protein 1A n=1 Tax=Hypanus sabinus TaxID=79690 RepID=UPI0028C3B9F1|nr:FHF complex subunit HOOK-interacting protein 1A [Hypanus sabinus]XP_059821009.1 FHF complex subunit HOOK-interacting protein 1A [Hypanus sabinus]XP_059821010.1 FHF complex subunit HOOK-interacting protein 1A [Hypanus sabinus]XP_059821011.1 FHF complex subunit HOOK-interacting protein 1A [Hypanus sabinus]XP_059821012.1 FHF complex subunit HOOK-interacting protein 1A [Hypanus sabinus]